jgi:integrase
MQPATPLLDVCNDTYFPQRLTITSKDTTRQYEIALRFFGRHLGHTPLLSDLTDDNLYAFIRHLQDLGLATTTINDRVGRLRALMEWLGRRKHIDRLPTVERLREPRRIPQAWTEEQLVKLFASVAQEDRDVGIIPGRLWWRACFALAWNTSERVSALMSLEWSWLDGDKLHVPAESRKGRRRDMLYTLWDETLATLEPLREYGCEHILEFPHCWPHTFYLRFGRILDRAGLPNDRKHKTHCLRVSHAT